MYRLWSLILAAALLSGCSNSTDTASKPGTEKAADKPSADAVAKKTDPADVDSTKSEPATKEPASPKELYDSLVKDARKAESEFMMEVRSAPREEQMALYMSGGPKNEFAVKFLELADEHPDSDFHFNAILFAATKGDADVSTQAFDLLVENYRDDKQIVKLLETFETSVNLPAQHHETFLRNLMEKSSNDSIKGAATYTLVKFFQGLASSKDMAGDPTMAKSIPQETIDYWMKDRGEDFDAELEKMLSDVSENYADVEFGRGKLGELAESELFVFKYLSVGKVAPDIEGVDLDGEAFKLSEYRGKVVMLDFWGDW